MVDWLVIAAAGPGLGRGVRGRTLATFLRTYFGRRAVRMCTPEEARTADDLSAQRCLLGFPSPLAPGEIEALASRAGGAALSTRQSSVGATSRNHDVKRPCSDSAPTSG